MQATDGARLVHWNCLAATLVLCCTQAVRARGYLDVDAVPSSRTAEGPVQIKMHSTADVPVRDVCIADVADLDGGPAGLREWIGKLDIADPPLASQPVRVTQQQIAFRIRLAGLDDRLVAFDGPREAWI